MLRGKEKEHDDQNSIQEEETHPDNISESEKIENITQQLNTAVNSVPVQPNDCVFIECNPILEHLPHEQTNFISVHQQHQAVNYNIPHHNQIQISGYTLQNVSQVPVYNGTYTMPLQQVQCNQVMPQMQVSILLKLMLHVVMFQCSQYLNN